MVSVVSAEVRTEHEKQKFLVLTSFEETFIENNTLIYTMFRWLFGEGEVRRYHFFHINCRKCGYNIYSAEERPNGPKWCVFCKILTYPKD
jgi:predicted nucleic-acid-binding Zn-ribbon protein